MSSRISVIVFKPARGAFDQASWIDPVSGREKRRSTGTEIKGDADSRLPVRLERQLLRRYLSRSFPRDLGRVPRAFEAEVVPSKAPKTGENSRLCLTPIERHIGPKRLAAVDADHNQPVPTSSSADRRATGGAVDQGTPGIPFKPRLSGRKNSA